MVSHRFMLLPKTHTQFEQVDLFKDLYLYAFVMVGVSIYIHPSRLQTNVAPLISAVAPVNAIKGP